MLERNTIISASVLNILKEAQNPISVTQILQALNTENLHPNKTTIYRILNKLLDKNIIHELTIKSDTKYYEIDDHSHHHHFMCTECQTLYCLNSCIINSQNINLNQLLPNDTFQIKSHDFNLYGICGDCSPQPSKDTQKT